MKLSAHESRKVLVDRNVAVKFVIQPEPLQGTENDGFPDFQARFQVLGGRDPVTEPDNFDLVRECPPGVERQVPAARRLYGLSAVGKRHPWGRNFTIDAIGCPLAIRHSSVRVKPWRVAG